MMLQKKDMPKFEHLMSPITIGSLKISNRIVFPAVNTGYTESDGTISPKMAYFYGELAQGGLGLIIVGATAVSSQGKFFSESPCIDDDRVLEGLAGVFRAIHDYGSMAAIQIGHGGRQSGAALNGTPLVAPSPIPCPVLKIKPRALSIEEIEKIEDQFAEGVVRARRAGADMVQFHGAHGYLIHQFLSPQSNKRTDRYGGNLENRMRFLLNLVKKSREKAGIDFPLSCRINGDDYQEGGLSLDDARHIARALAKEGVQFIDVSGGVRLSWDLRENAMAAGDFRRLARGIRETVDVPVSCVGMITDLNTAEGIINEGIADMVAMARALIADPELIQKSLGGNFDSINPCIRCDICHYWRNGRPRLTCPVYGRW